MSLSSSGGRRVNLSPAADAIRCRLNEPSLIVPATTLFALRGGSIEDFHDRLIERWRTGERSEELRAAIRRIVARYAVSGIMVIVVDDLPGDHRMCTRHGVLFSSWCRVCQEEKSGKV